VCHDGCSSSQGRRDSRSVHRRGFHCRSCRLGRLLGSGRAPHEHDGLLRVPVVVPHLVRPVAVVLHDRAPVPLALATKPRLNLFAHAECSGDRGGADELGLDGGL